ncbi:MULTISPECIES: helix-turn-helix domain-containing protein [unclassified Mycobacterium]|uniref:helix-turn-helix domain-containing protein n=1 Tax=unclassified Mycobacterium TaxID=2642494 RepID=UPI0029C74C31|nr:MULTISPECIES: helix-turn-helix domain-containing protein [unclassified Mycobacterium]
MSWKALDWATDINVGSPTMRLILILLANKADEQFSCYPSVRTLMAESCAARSTVLNALNRLEREGLITRVAQYHESGAQRCSRYFLHHPDAAHLKAGPNPGPPGPQAGRAGSPTETGRVQDLDPPGVRRTDALNPPEESPSEPSRFLRSMPEPWRLSDREAAKLSPAIERALASGWTAQSLKAHLSRSPEGVRYPAAVLARHLAELPTPPNSSLRRGISWCGECEDDQSRTITITLPNGTEAATFCPRCSPQMRPGSVGRHISEFDSRGGETIGEQRL